MGKFDIEYLRNRESFSCFKEIILIDEYPYSLEIKINGYLKVYGENIILSIHDTTKYWSLISDNKINTCFPGITVEYSDVVTINVDEDISSTTIIEYLGDGGKSEYVLLLTSNGLLIHGSLSSYFGDNNINYLFKHPDIPDSPAELLLYCLGSKEFSLIDCKAFPYLKSFRFRSVEKETCHKENGYLFRNIVDIDGKKFHTKKYIFKGVIPGVKVKTKGDYSRSIETTIEIHKKAQFSILVGLYHIDYRREYDRYYESFNSSDRDIRLYIYYNYDLLSEELKIALQERDYSKINSLIGHFKEKIDCKELIYN